MKATALSLFSMVLIAGGVLVNPGSAAGPDDGDSTGKVKLERLN